MRPIFIYFYLYYNYITIRLKVGFTDFKFIFVCDERFIRGHIRHEQYYILFSFTAISQICLPYCPNVNLLIYNTQWMFWQADLWLFRDSVVVANTEYTISSPWNRTCLVSHSSLLVVIVVIISGSTVLVRTLAASHQRIRNLIMALGTTPLDKWSARRKRLNLQRTTQHRNTKTSMPRAGFQPTTPVTKRTT
jgi:hypothetical protein